ncbi:MAG: hypothetical protein ACO4CT_04330 [Planctomycetota bacterium]
MTLTVLELVWLLGVPLLVGLGLLRWMGQPCGAERGTTLSWAYLVGSLAAAAVLWIWTLTGKPVPGAALWWGLGGVGTLLAVGARRCRAGQEEAAPARMAPKGPEDALFAVVVGLLLLHVLDEATARNAVPILAGDEGNIWAAKAKVLHVAPDSVSPAFREEAALFVQHPDYPLLNPLLQLGAFEVAGRLTGADSRLPIQTVMLALVLMAASALRRFVRPFVAGALLLALFTTDMSRFLAGSAYADHLVMFGLFAAVDAWSRFRMTGDPRWFRLSCLGMVFAILAKNEGTMLCLLAVVVGGSLRALRVLAGPSVPPTWRERGWLAAPFCAVLAIQAHNAVLAFRNDLFDPAVDASGLTGRLFAQFQEHAGVVAAYAWREILVAPATTHLVFGGLLVGLLVIVLVPSRRPRTEFLVPALCTFGALAVYQLVFVATPYEIDKHLPAAAVRVAMHVAPLSVMAQAMLWGDLFPALRSRERVRSPASALQSGSR